MAFGRCVTNTFLKEEMWCCTRDEGGPLDAGGQVQASNHCKLLSSKAISKAASPKLSSQRTPRWREMDSNYWYRGTKAVDFRSIPGIWGYRRGS